VEAVRIFRHKDYALHCEARALDNGRFVPTLSVLRQVWPSRPKEIAVPRTDYATEIDAIEAAHQIGIRWVSEFG
jgi:hypothetical protein